MSGGGQRTRGRNRFFAFKGVLRLGAAIFRPLPEFLLDAMWTFSDLSAGAVGLGLRYMILRARAASCGDVVYVGKNVDIKGWSTLRVGKNVSIQRACYLDATGGLTIGDDVSIAHQCSIVSNNHSWLDASLPIRDNPTHVSPVVIHSDVWIGCGSRVMPGVEICSRSVVAAGAVVNRFVPAHTVVAGVPAREVKKI